MRAFLPATVLIWFLSSGIVYAQPPSVDKVGFFSDTSILDATISTNLPKLIRQKKEGFQFTGTFTTTLPNSSVINEPVLLEIRGHMRKDYCYLPPLRVNFKYEKSSPLSPLGSIKLVSQCKTSDIDDQYLLKEFLVYKIYNLLTDMSFRVRLINLSLTDSSGKKKTITEHAFLMEDIKDLAKRNQCRDWKNNNFYQEDADRRQMTLVAIFEYMIGNTDWGIPASHNTRLIVSKIDSLKRPFVVPYDFDYSGFVNTDYAVPDEKLGIENVRERLYRGFPRTMEELNEVLAIFKKQKEKIYAVINNFNLLTTKSKKDMINYLDDFFYMINQPEMVQNVFIRNARTE